MTRGLKSQPSRTSGPERGKSFHCDDYFSGLLDMLVLVSHLLH